MYTVARECRIPVFGNRITLKDTDKEAGKIVHHINPNESLNAPEFGIMANHKDSNELQTEREPGNSDKRVINNFQKETQLRLRTNKSAIFTFSFLLTFGALYFFHLSYLCKGYNLCDWNIPLMSASSILDYQCKAYANVCYEAALIDRTLLLAETIKNER